MLNFKYFCGFQEDSESQILLHVSRKILKTKYFCGFQEGWWKKIVFCLLGQYRKSNIVFFPPGKCWNSNIFAASRKMVKVKYCFCLPGKSWKSNIARKGIVWVTWVLFGSARKCVFNKNCLLQCSWFMGSSQRYKKAES